MYIMLHVTSPSEIEYWEATILFIMYPMFLAISVLIERKISKQSKPFYNIESSNLLNISDASNKTTNAHGSFVDSEINIYKLRPNQLKRKKILKIIEVNHLN